MKKGILLILMVILALLLGACGGQTPASWETVEDSIPVLSTEPLSDYRITFAVPEDAVLETAVSDQEPVYYTARDGSYEILAQRIESDSIQTVATMLSGFRYDELSPLCWEESGMDRYDFVWASTEDAGQMVHRAAVYQDGGVYYTVTFSVLEEAAESCQEKMQTVFSTLGLNANEGF